MIGFHYVIAWASYKYAMERLDLTFRTAQLLGPPQLFNVILAPICSIDFSSAWVAWEQVKDSTPKMTY